MLTKDRFNQIKAATSNYEKSHVTELDLAGLGDIFQMLLECVAEVERVQILGTMLAQTPRTNARARPVMLDVRGQRIVPPPISQQLEAERREQYAVDRYEALMTLDMKAEPDATPPHLVAWRRFSLRWGLLPPPRGWHDEEQITNAMHAIRIVIVGVPHFAKQVSAAHLVAKGIALPDGAQVIDGVLHTPSDMSPDR